MQSKTKQINHIPIFFIVGRPRSGTTLLRTLFDAHPHVIVPPECQFVINLYPKYGKITDWKEKDLDNFYHELKKQWLFDLWPLDIDSLYGQLKEYTGHHTYADICKLVYASYNSVFNHGKLLAIGDKNPGYAIYTPRLLKIFPEAKFIHIIRDYRDNFVSIRNVDFELPFISVTVTKWKIFLKKFRKASKQNPGTHLELRYEDLVANPEIIFEKLCDFLGIPYSAVPFDFYKKKDEALKMYPKELLEKYQSSLFKKIDTSRTELWKAKLTNTEVRVGDAVAGKYAELAGYERKFTSTSLFIWLRSLPGICLAHILNCATSVVDTFPYKLRIAILIKAPWAIGRLYLRIFNRKKLKEVTLAVKK